MQTLELVSEEQVYDSVKSNGPLVPIDVRKVLKAGDSIIIGATLSTLVERGKVLITSIKRGGSPFYYIKGQEEKLQSLSIYLNEKDKKTFETLKEKSVLRDNAEDPLTRVSLRNIPDFAKKMTIEINGNKEIFWKWYLISDEDAVKVISGKNALREKEPSKEIQKEIPKEALNVPETNMSPEKRAGEEKESESKEKKKKEKTDSFLEVKPEIQQQLDMTGVPQIVAQYHDAFINKISSFLIEGKINIKEARQIKRGVEYDLTIQVPTFVGTIEFFCKAKSKKKCSENDLSSAYLQGQNMRLPTLFLTTGEIAKKAKEKAHEYKSLTIKEI
jgi:hypothetical protein